MSPIIKNRISPILVLFIAALVLILPPTSKSDNLISYQGRLTNIAGIPVADGDYSVTFRLFDNAAAGTSLWTETAVVTTTDGLFDHQLGSEELLPSILFTDNATLYLELSLNGEALSPRTRLTSAPSAIVSQHLLLTDDTGTVYIRTEIDKGGVVAVNDSTGDTAIILNGGQVSDSAVVLPDSAISDEEILDEPGIATLKNVGLVDLSTGTMTDLVTIQITLPDAGYIVLHGKCYLLLSGTTGANSARIQIDDTEGGSSIFPYYTQAGLGGYVNTEVSYFPIYVTRTYFRQAGTYTFRMEGQAANPLPAMARSWDHILTAVYFPTSYGSVSTISSEPGDHPEARLLKLDNGGNLDRSGTFYEMDLRYYERQAREKRK